MIRSGLIMAVVSFFIFTITSYLVNCCGLFSAVVLGLAAGFFAVSISNPPVIGKAALYGAGAGAVAGFGAVVGQVAGSLVSGLLSATKETLAEALQQFFQQSSVLFSTILTDPSMTLVGICGIIDELLMAGFGALGGLLRYRSPGTQTPVPQPPKAAG